MSDEESKVIPIMSLREKRALRMLQDKYFEEHGHPPGELELEVMERAAKTYYESFYETDIEDLCKSESED